MAKKPANITKKSVGEKRKEMDSEDKPEIGSTVPTGGRKIITRSTKKARETLDFISGSKQRQTSLFDLLGKDYTGPNEQQLRMIFNIFDTDHDGKIGPEELSAVLRSMGKRPLTKRIDKILNECDKNGNGYIEMDEFIQYIQNKAMEKAKMLGLVDSEDEESDHEGGDTDEEEASSTPKKKAAAAKKKTSTKKKEAKNPKTTTTATAKTVTKQPSFFAPMKKGSSIIHYYNPNAGLPNMSGIEVDPFNNPVSVEYDLGVEGAFTDFTILFGLFYPFSDELKCQNSLASKGFKIVIAKNQKEFIGKLEEADISIIVPFKENDNTTTKDEFVAAVKKFHEDGKGLYLWAENEPFFVQTNWILEELFKCKATGNDPGTKDLKLASNPINPTGNTVQTFKSHLITSGLVTLFEGRTVSYIDQVPESFEAIATNSSNHPIILASKPSEFSDNCGRIVVDTGYTKLLNEFFSAGIERYIKNACVWLLGLDHKFRLGVEHRGPVSKPKEIPQWQYFHGNWFDYDREANFIVEECYQDWLSNPHIDVRSVKSGHWCYQVDFKQNKQTNIQHQSHTQRDIRRILKNVIVSTD